MIRTLRRLQVGFRLGKAIAAHDAAVIANERATERQDTRRMHETRAAVYQTLHAKMAAEVALDALTPKRGERSA